MPTYLLQFSSLHNSRYRQYPFAQLICSGVLQCGLKISGLATRMNAQRVPVREFVDLLLEYFLTNQIPILEW